MYALTFTILAIYGFGMLALGWYLRAKDGQ